VTKGSPPAGVLATYVEWVRGPEGAKIISKYALPTTAQPTYKN
jgi:hypothetical protein